MKEKSKEAIPHMIQELGPKLENVIKEAFFIGLSENVDTKWLAMALTIMMAKLNAIILQLNIGENADKPELDFEYYLDELKETIREEYIKIQEKLKKNNFDPNNFDIKGFVSEN